MTANEIEKSGIYDAAIIEVTLKNGEVERLGNRHILFTKPIDNTAPLYGYSPKYNKLFGEVGSKRIIIDGEDIISIKVLVNKEEALNQHENNNAWENIVYILLFVGSIVFAFNGCLN